MKSIWRIIAPILALFPAGCSKKDNESSVRYSAKDGTPIQDLRHADGDIKFEVLGSGNVPAAARAWHEKGREQGAAGNYQAAMGFLEKARQAAPKWPYPVYDMAYTYLLQKDYTNALAKYREVDALDPDGFFATKTAIWTLDREEKIFPAGSYLNYLALESLDGEEKRKLVEQIADKIPEFAPIWKEKALLANSEDEKLRLIARGLALNPDAETYGILMINRAAILHQKRQVAEAKQILQSLLTKTNTTGTRAVARQVLDSF